MAEEIISDQTEWEMVEKVNKLCSRLSKVPFKNWDYIRKGLGLGHMTREEYESRQNELFELFP